MDKKSETLRQREKAQKDLLELKKMQRGEIDSSVLNDDDKKIVPKTMDEKCENFFFYHKYKLLFAAAVVAVLAIIITSMINTPNYDATLTIYCYEYVAENEIEDVESWINKNYADTNGNGRVDVLTTDCSFSSDTALADTVHQRQLKIQSILVDPEAMLYLLDDESLKYLNSATDSFTLFKEENIVKLDEDFYKALDTGRVSLKEGKDRYLCLRTVEGSSIEGAGNKNYAAAKDFIEKLKK